MDDEKGTGASIKLMDNGGKQCVCFSFQTRPLEGLNYYYLIL